MIYFSSKSLITFSISWLCGESSEHSLCLEGVWFSCHSQIRLVLPNWNNWVIQRMTSFARERNKFECPPCFTCRSRISSRPWWNLPLLPFLRPSRYFFLNFRFPLHPLPTTFAHRHLPCYDLSKLTIQIFGIFGCRMLVYVVNQWITNILCLALIVIFYISNWFWVMLRSLMSNDWYLLQALKPHVPLIKFRKGSG